MTRRLPQSTPFPYTTLFRSQRPRPGTGEPGHPGDEAVLGGRAEPAPGVHLVGVMAYEGHVAGVGHHAHQVYAGAAVHLRSEEHTSELQSHSDLVCRLLLEKK